MNTQLHRSFLFLTALALAVMLAQAVPVHAALGGTTRVSLDSSGVEGNHNSGEPSIAADGCYVAFESGADNLVSGDTNGSTDIFVRDIVNNITMRVSLNSSGVEGNNDSYYPSISQDGRYVAFASGADNLVSGDTNGVYDIFVRDILTNTTTRISLESAGTEGNAESWDPSISANGRYVAFISDATNLGSGDTNGEYDIFVHDTQTQTTTRVSLNSSGVEGNSLSAEPSISADGRYVAFKSYASNLVSGDVNGMEDIFVRDTLTNTTTRVSLNSSGVEGNNSSSEPSISADGRFVAFASYASNLVSGDVNGTADIFVRDTLANTTTRASLDSSGAEGNDSSEEPSISADGRFVAFASYASNLVSGDTGASNDIFVRDTLTNTTTRISLDSSGVEGNGESYEPSILADGYSYLVVFSSGASNLVSGDTNGMNDVFHHITSTDTIPPEVVSIKRANPNPTSKRLVSYTVTFSEAVTGVDLYDFILSTAIPGASLHGFGNLAGDTYSVTINTGTGNGTIKLNLRSSGTGIQDLAGNPINGGFYNGEIYTVQKQLSIRSSGVLDGWILESAETSNKGGTLNRTSTTLRLGDDAARKQYRSILSFSTGSLPDNAVITKVTLKVRKQTIIGGGNPVTAFQGFMVDIKKGMFGTSILLPADFQAPTSKTYGPFNTALINGWYNLSLTSGKAYINKLATNGGLTQIRLRFKLDDNNNAIANYLSLYSGNAAIAFRPMLIIDYYTP